MGLMAECLARLFKEGGHIFYTHGNTRHRLRTRELGVEGGVHAWVDRAQRGLFGHNQSISPKAKQGPCAQTLCRNDDLEFVAKCAQQIGKTPSRKSLSASCVEYERYSVHDPEVIEMMNKEIKNLRGHFSFKATSISGEVNKHSRVSGLFDGSVKGISF